MRATHVLALLGAVSIALGAGCHRRESTPPATNPAVTPSTPPAANTVSGSGAEEARAVLLSSVHLGRGLGNDGTVTAPGEVFHQGDPLFVSLNVSPISPGSEVKLVWIGPGGKTNGQEQMVVPPAADVVNFRAKDTRTWQPGDHRIEVWLGGARIGDKPFRIEATATAANLPH